ncbi:MAG: tRNA (guanine(26)-N(2)/guanine(27)-N(2))-dimethyltransferase [Candidatus Woesearchaeota archaeon]|nr:MAG: tRNA (guanine(26)-N(2)/guanine(27)-N(2))-dimethyltransferase [Candidatus Woesearchaeota archaeon]
MEIIQEGMSKFYASRDKNGKISKELDVFYNPVMKFNRDVSITLLNVINQSNMQMCDLMAGSGVRSLRFIKELKKGVIGKLVVNDYDEGFIRLFKKNLELNDIDETKSNVYVYSMDANKLLLESTGFDYIDIDPFGSPNDFLENSIVRLSREGILAVTATDTAPLAGTFPDACIRKYWAKPLRNHLMHEIGLRILIRKIQLIGAQHDKALIPMYSYYKDHYFRVFFKCVKGKKECDNILRQHEYLLYCNTCQSFLTSEINQCMCCNQQMEYAGPLWTGQLYDSDIAFKIFKMEKSNSLLKIIADESLIKSIGFYDIHELAKKHKFLIPNYEKLLLELNKLGKSVRTHFSNNGIKSELSVKEILSVLNVLKDK